jgi:transcriptional regulator with XRE-family HTH domain
MPEIGATLREARMRARIDISDIEAETKIRAKYLRALENEEWNLLPGPTYVKSFLRTYAEALGLDAKLLVEEYKLRHERLSESELRPIAATAPGGAGRRRPQPRGISPGAVVGVIVVIVVVALYLLGRNSNNNDVPPPAARTTATNTNASSSSGSAPVAPPKRTRKPSNVVRLQVVASGTVYVCLVAKGNRTLIPGSTLQAGDTSPTFRSTRFRVNLGNSQVKLRINGKLRAVPASSTAIGYEITRKGRRTLGAGQRPTCGG